MLTRLFRRRLAAFLLFAFSVSIASPVQFAFAQEISKQNMVELLTREHKTIALKTTADRVEIGTPGIIGLFMKDNTHLTVKGLKPGFSSLMVRYSDGTLIQYGITVNAAAPQVLSNFLAQIKEHLKPVPGLKITMAGDKVVIAGDVSPGYSAYFKQIVTMYSDVVLDLTGATLKNRTVEVDVKVVEVTGDYNREMGIQWFADGAWTVEGSASTTPTDISHLSNFIVAGQVDVKNVNFALIALTNAGKAKLLATPKIIVESGKHADFLAGGEVPIVSVTSDTSTVEYKPFGTELTISPVIQDSNEIFIDVKASFSRLDFSQAVDGNPTILKKSAVTSLTVKSGTTFAIAGLVSYDETITESKVPFLGSIPLIGYLFKSKTVNKTRDEIIIFMTPTILPNKSNTRENFKAGIEPTDKIEKAMIDQEKYLNKSTTKRDKRVTKWDKKEAKYLAKLEKKRAKQEAKEAKAEVKRKAKEEKALLKAEKKKTSKGLFS
jgi:pilus assembly protein CpaC